MKQILTAGKTGTEIYGAGAQKPTGAYETEQSAEYLLTASRGGRAERRATAVKLDIPDALRELIQIDEDDDSSIRLRKRAGNTRSVGVLIIPDERYDAWKTLFPKGLITAPESRYSTTRRVFFAVDDLPADAPHSILDGGVSVFFSGYSGIIPVGEWISTPPNALPVIPYADITRLVGTPAPVPHHEQYEEDQNISQPTTPDLQAISTMSLPEAAAAYEAVGWSILDAQPRSKKVLRNGWTTTPRLVQASHWQRKGHEEDNIGCNDGYTRLLVVDIDSVQCFATMNKALDERLMSDAGVTTPYHQLQTAHIRSGRPDSDKLVFWMPRGSDQLPYRGVKWKHPEKALEGVVEYRADANHQDILPPSVHPSGRTYRWEGTEILDAPADLLLLIRNWDEYEDTLQAANPDPVIKTKKKAQDEPAKKKKTKKTKEEEVEESERKAYGDQYVPYEVARIHISEDEYRRWESSISDTKIRDWLRSAGYTDADDGERMQAPHTTSEPGVVVLRDADNDRWIVWSHHASDPLCDDKPHGPWDIICLTTQKKSAAVQVYAYVHPPAPVTDTPRPKKLDEIAEEIATDPPHQWVHHEQKEDGTLTSTPILTYWYEAWEQRAYIVADPDGTGNACHWFDGVRWHNDKNGHEFEAAAKKCLDIAGLPSYAAWCPGPLFDTKRIGRGGARPTGARIVCRRVTALFALTASVS